MGLSRTLAKSQSGHRAEATGHIGGSVGEAKRPSVKTASQKCHSVTWGLCVLGTWAVRHQRTWDSGVSRVSQSLVNDRRGPRKGARPLVASVPWTPNKSPSCSVQGA